MTDPHGAHAPSPSRADKLLFVSPVYPWPLDRGQNIRIHHLVLACVRDHEVTLVAPRPQAAVGRNPVLESAVTHLQYVDSAPRTTSWRDSLAFLRRHGALRRPGVVAALLDYQRQLETLDLDAFRIVWVERLMLTALFRDQARRLIVDLDDLEHRKSWRAARVQRVADVGTALAAVRHLYYAVRFFGLEVTRPRRLLSALLASPEDCCYLRSWGVRTAALVPNGVDLPPTSHGQGRRRSDRLVFLGNLEYYANRDALVVLARDVLPVVQERWASASLHVLGGGVTDALREQFPQVVFHGFVPDLHDALAGFGALVAPLRIGGGTKLKVLEAMASGLPVVTTSVGAEGLGLENGVSALIADTPQELAEAVLALQQDPSLGERLAGQALQVVRRFTWQDIRESVADHLTALGRSGPSSPEAAPPTGAPATGPADGG